MAIRSQWSATATHEQWHIKAIRSKVVSTTIDH